MSTTKILEELILFDNNTSIQKTLFKFMLHEIIYSINQSRKEITDDLSGLYYIEFIEKNYSFFSLTNTFKEIYFPTIGLLISDQSAGRLNNEYFWKEITIFSTIKAKRFVGLNRKEWIYLQKLYTHIIKFGNYQSMD